MACIARSDLSLPEPSASRIGRLRQQLRAAETTTSLAGERDALIALGIMPIDDVLGGGLACGSLHEIAAARETETPAATAFALALAACRVRQTHAARSGRLGMRNAGANNGHGVVWVAEDLSRAENGLPYGPGLDEAGIAPEQLIMVAAAQARDVLWAMEEALRCRAIGVIIGEMRGNGIEPLATRRLSLAAAAGKSLGLLLRTAAADEPCAAATRWIIEAAPSLRQGEGRSGLDAPRITARLVRNRRSPFGAWIVEWNSVEQRFKLATHPEPVAGAAFDRPARTVTR